MRTLAAPAQAALGGRFALAELVEMDLTLPVRVALCRDTITWSGREFVGGRAASIEAIKDSAGETVRQAFTLSGVPADMLAIALAEPIQGKACRVYVALLDADTGVVLDAQQVWAGLLDQMPISQSGEAATVTATAEHRAITFARPKGLRYTDADQQALFPGDRCLEFLASQASHQDVWPSAAFFRQ